MDGPAGPSAGERAWRELSFCACRPGLYIWGMLTMDSLLCLWVVAALAAAHVAISTGKLRWHWWLLSAGACGLGLLTKGPVALVLVVAPVLLVQALDQRLARPRFKMWLVYLFVAIGLACPWFLALGFYDPAFAGDFFWTHNVVRYVNPLDHEEPPWFFLPSLLVGMLPWSMLLVPLVKLLARRSPEAGQGRPAALGVYLLASLWCLIFFSLGGCKRAGYVLPAMPPLALALGCCVDGFLPRGLFRQTGAALAGQGAKFAYRATMLVLGAAAVLMLVAVFAGLQKPGRGVALALLACLGLGCVYRFGRGRRAVLAWALCGATTFALLLIGVHLFLPRYNCKFSLRAQVRPQISPGTQVPVSCYPHRWDSVSFYLDRNDVRTYAAGQLRDFMTDLQSQPQTMVFVKSDHSLSELIRGLPESLEFVLRGPVGIVTGGVVRQRKGARPPDLASQPLRMRFSEKTTDLFPGQAWPETRMGFSLLGGESILAEIEFLCGFFAERIPHELLVAFRAQIKPKILVGRRGNVWIDDPVFLLPEKLADRFHVILVQIGLRQGCGVVRSEDLHLDHVTVVFSRRKFLAAEITGDV